MRIGIHRISMGDPADVGELRALLEDGTVEVASIVASIGNTEGNPFT